MHQVNTFEFFVQKILTNKLQKKNVVNKINLFPVLLKAHYVKLLNNSELFNFYIKPKKKNFFSSKYVFNYIKNLKGTNKKIILNKFSLSYIKSYFESINFFCYFYLLIIKFYIGRYTNTKEIIVYVEDLKHFLLCEKILKKTKLKYSYLSFSRKIIKKIKLNKSSLCELSLIDVPKNFRSSDHNFHISQFKVFDNLFKNNKVKVIIGFEGDNSKFEVLCQAAKHNGVKSICIQSGCFTSKKPRLQLGHNSFDFFISWGKYFSNQIKSINKNTKFINIGKIYKIKKFKKKNIVTILTSSPNYDEPEKFWIQIFILVFELSKKFKNWKFIIRDHPDFSYKEKIKKLGLVNKNIFFQKADKIDINYSLSISKIVVGIRSSALIEALAFNTIPVVYNANPNFIFSPDLNKNKIGFISSKIKKIEKNLVYLMLRQNYKPLSINIKRKKNLYFENLNKNRHILLKNFINKI